MTTLQRPPELAPEDINIYELYPSSDGELMAENERQAEAMTYTRGALINWLREREGEGIHILMDTLIYYEEGDNSKRLAPDICVFFGSRSDHPRSSWLMWMEGQIYPGFVLEVISPGTYTREWDKKQIYQDYIKAKELWWFDPFGLYLPQALMGWRLVNDLYAPIEVESDTDEREELIGRSQTIELDVAVRIEEPRLKWSEELKADILNRQLRLIDPVTGEVLRNHLESETGRLEAEAGRLEAEAGRMEERRARIVAENMADEERSGRLEAEAGRLEERRARIAAEEEIERLRALLRSQS